MIESSKTTRRERMLPLAVGVAAVLLAACASTPPAPTESLLAARTAIATAEKANAGRYAAQELGAAREKLTAANSAVEMKNMSGAQRLAEQSRVSADLAAAKTERAKATAVNDEMKKSNDALVEEMQRKTGSQP
jgi:hypothetical protein